MKLGDAADLYRLVQEMSAILNRDAPLVQVFAFLRVATNGDTGIDQGELAEDIGLSNSATSRTVQALSSIHYLKDWPGYGLVERVFDPTDNRRRELKLTAKGKRAVDRLAEALKKGAAR